MASHFGCIIGTPLTHSGDPNLCLKFLPQFRAMSYVLNIFEINFVNSTSCGGVPLHVVTRDTIASEMS